MGVSFLPAIDGTNAAGEGKGLDTTKLAYFAHVHATVSSSSLDQAHEHLHHSLDLYRTSLDVTKLSSIDDIVALLDAGAASAFVSSKQYQQLSCIDNLDTARLVLSIDAAHQDSLSDSTIFHDRALHIYNVNGLQIVERALKNRKSDEAPLYITLSKPSAEVAHALAKDQAIVIIPSSMLTLEETNSGLINAAKLFMASATSDRADGLFTTLVTDERGVALGLVYSSKESVSESLRTGRGVYQSRKRGLWYKGESSGDVQELVTVELDCDNDCLRFTVRQKGKGFCHLSTATCFGHYKGLSALQRTLQARKESAPQGSYTARLFNDSALLSAKIKEEAAELCEATERKHIAFEAADLFYFALTKCVSAGVSLEDVERNLDAKSVKVKRRKGDAKPGYISSGTRQANGNSENSETVKEAASVPKAKDDLAGIRNDKIKMTRYVTAEVDAATIEDVLQRPSQRSTDTIMNIVKPILQDVRTGGDAALLSYTHKFEKATTLTSPVLNAPFPASLMDIPRETIDAIDTSFTNIHKFHSAQKESKPLKVETMPGVVCSRFSRPIERVGLYVPGGTAVLPSTALMLGVPALVAGCKTIVIATPPRADGSVTPEIVYVAHKVGAQCIVLAGGAQAVAALAYGTASVPKVDKILGPGNQFVTAGKMLVSNDTTAGVSIDMPAGPSEVLVVADATSVPAFVASDLLSQAEHGADSQVVLIAVDMNDMQIQAIEDELHAQASALPRVEIVRSAIEHSVTLVAKDIDEAMRLSNQYAPEHLILQVENPEHAASLVENAGSIFIGNWTPESVGDYSAGVNHSLPTYGYARQYSGVNLASYVKHITSSQLTEQGLRNVGGAVMQLAKVEELEAHRRAVSIRLAHMDGEKKL